MKSKIVWGGEWVRIRNLMNKNFVALDPRCSICRLLSCAVVWYSIRTREIRCTKCFTPTGA